MLPEQFFCISSNNRPGCHPGKTCVEINIGNVADCNAMVADFCVLIDGFCRMQVQGQVQAVRIPGRL